MIAGPIWGFLSNVGIFHYRWGLSVLLNLVDWKTHSSVLQQLLQYFETIFLDFVDFFSQSFDVYQLLGPIWDF